MHFIRYRRLNGLLVEISRENTMALRFETIQRVAVSVVGAVFFAAIAIGTAAPIIPIA